MRRIDDVFDVIGPSAHGVVVFEIKHQAADGESGIGAGKAAADELHVGHLAVVAQFHLIARELNFEMISVRGRE